MALRYVGFDQEKNTRAYKFEQVTEGEDALRFVVSADLALFLKHHVGIQEGPGLCAHKLSADLEKTKEGDHRLTDEDLLSYVAARAAAEARRAESRKHSARRRPPIQRRDAGEHKRHEGPFAPPTADYR